MTSDQATRDQERKKDYADDDDEEDDAVARVYDDNDFKDVDNKEDIIIASY